MCGGGNNCGMIVLFSAAMMYLFLLVGAIAFLLCVAIRPLRRFALSVALWFAVWGPSCVVLMVLAILGVIASGFAMRTTRMEWTSLPHDLIASLGLGLGVVSIFLICVIATGAAWIHQLLIHRFTFLLFRLYATVVCGGIGSVFGWLVCWWLMAEPSAPYRIWVCPFGMLFLVAAFGSQAYRKARALRGDAPTSFTWITPEEFAGPVES